MRLSECRYNNSSHCFFSVSLFLSHFFSHFLSRFLCFLNQSGKIWIAKVAESVNGIGFGMVYIERDCGWWGWWGSDTWRSFNGWVCFGSWDFDYRKTWVCFGSWEGNRYGMWGCYLLRVEWLIWPLFYLYWCFSPSMNMGFIEIEGNWDFELVLLFWLFNEYGPWAYCA